MSETQHRLKSYEKKLEDYYPHLIRFISDSRKLFKKEGFSWSGCYAPPCLVSTIVKNYDRIQKTGKFQLNLERGSLDQILTSSQLVNYLSWRVSKGVYTFNTSLYNALVSSEFGGEIPVEVLKRLPEWGVYITLQPGITLLNKEVQGVIVTVSTTKFKASDSTMFYTTEDIESVDTHINFSFDLVNRDKIFMPFPIQLVIKAGDSVSTAMSPEKAVSNTNEGNTQWIEQQQAVKKVLPLLLYLCSEKRELRVVKGNGTKYEPKASVLSKFQIPTKIKSITIGEVLGAELRRFEQELKQYPNRKGGKKAPHMRRGHWHGVWKGKKDSGIPQRFEYNWLPPMFINAEEV